jgi:hypothetical protein
MNPFLSFAKVWFVLSFVAFSFLYGTGVGKWKWFPHSFLNRAMDQARQVWDAENIASHSQVFDRHGTRVYRPKRVQSGMTAITSWWKSSDGLKVGIKLVDRRGEVLHEWLVDRGQIFQGEGMLQRRDPTGTDIQGFLLLPDGDVLINLEYVGMARLNSCGKVLWTLTEGNHHSIARAEDGSFWVPGVSQERRAGRVKNPALPGCLLPTICR